MSDPNTSAGAAFDPELYCPGCGYDLRGIDSQRCPECGLEIDRTILGESIVPWLHREKLGRARAFWRTVNMATFRPRFLAREMSRPARFHDAVLFRRLVVLHAWLPLVLLGVVGLVYAGLTLPANWFWAAENKLGSVLQLVLLVLALVCLLLFFMAVSGVASYFFHPKSLSIVRQNRAVALSYYACAPLAYTPLTAGLAGLFVAASVLEMTGASVLIRGAVVLIGLAPLIVQLLFMLRVPVVLLRWTTHCTTVRAMVFSVFLPVSWGLVAMLLLGVVPWACVMIVLMIISLGS